MNSDASSVSWWAVIEAVATAGAMAVAALQIFLARRDANNRAAFAHLAEIDSRLQRLLRYQVADAQANVLAYYRNEISEVSESAQAYFALLNSLEILAYAKKKGIVSTTIVDDFISTAIPTHVIPLSFLRDLQECCKDAGVYEHLYDYVRTLRSKDRPTARSSE